MGIDLHSGDGLVVHVHPVDKDHAQVSLLQRTTPFDDARVLALAVFYLALVHQTGTDFVFTDHTYQSVVVRADDLTEPTKLALARAARVVGARRSDVLTAAEVYFTGRYRSHTVPVGVVPDLLPFKGAEFIGRDFVEAVARQLAKP